MTLLAQAVLPDRQCRHVQTLAQRADDLEITGEEEEVGQNPGRRIGQGRPCKPERRHQEQGNQCACDHFKDAGQHGHLGIAHPLNGEAQHIDKHQRDVEQAVIADIRHRHPHDFRLSGSIHKDGEQHRREQDNDEQGEDAVEDGDTTTIEVVTIFLVSLFVVLELLL